MRKGGVVEAASGLTPFGRPCWVHTSRADFGARAAEDIADGMAAGRWVEYVGAGEPAELRDELCDLPGIRAGLDRGRSGVSPIREFYRFGAAL